MAFPLSRARIAELLAGVRGKHLVVVGDAMLDVYLSGDVQRISPEAPVPIVRVRERKQALGGAANVAQNVLAIGCACTLVAARGNDNAGEELGSMLKALGVTDEMVRMQRGTTQKTRIVARSQQLVRVDEEQDSDFAESEMDALCEAAERAIGAADALILEDYNKGVLSERMIQRTIGTAIARDIPIIVDPKFRNFFSYRGATLFKPNHRELEAALGAQIGGDDGIRLQQALDRLDVEHLLLTLGEEGMMLASRKGDVERVATVARQVYDVVGAGDTVTAYVGAILAAGGEAIEAATIANIAAGIEVGKLGAATVTVAELLQYVDEHGLHH